MASVDPEAKSSKRMREHARGTQCLNCGLAIDTNYCPNCGQHNTSHNHGLSQFFHEFMDEIFHLDSKIVRTLVPLFVRPGYLTQEWAAGKRIRYITPLKLYVTLSAFCFLAISLKGSLYGEPKDNFKISYNPPPASQTVARSASTGKAQNDFPAAENAMDNLFKRKIGKPDRAGIESVKEKFIARLPTTNFLLMPIVAGVFYLLYIRSKRFYVEHLVFTLHYYSFGFGVLTVVSLIPPIPVVSTVIGIAAAVWTLVYLPIALVRNYRQSYLKTLLKLGVFGICYTLLITFALFCTLIVTAMSMPDRPQTVDLGRQTAVNPPSP